MLSQTKKTTPEISQDPANARSRKLGPGYFFRKHKKLMKARGLPVLSFDQYSKLLLSINKKISRAIIADEYIFRPPYGNGEFFMRQFSDRKPNHYKGPLTSFHNGKMFKLFWYKAIAKSKYSGYFHFACAKGPHGGYGYGFMARHLKALSSQNPPREYHAVEFE